MEVTVELQKLSKRFGPIEAVKEVSFTARRGEVLGFLGPNGAGKSTTMKMLTCFLAPSAGTASVCGFDIQRQSMEVRRRIGYLPEGAPAYPDMTAGAYLNFIADVRGLRGAKRREALDRAIERIGLQHVLRQSVETLSKGFKRRVGLAQAILHDPEVLILDEPTDGLDPNQKHEVRGLIQEMAAEKVIILSTHILEEVEAVCSRAVIIARGRVIFDGTPDELEARDENHHAVVMVLPTKDLEKAAKVLRGVEGVRRVDVETESNGTGRVTVVPQGSENVLIRVAETARANAWNVIEMRSETGRLDDVFRSLTAGSEGGRS